MNHKPARLPVDGMDERFGFPSDAISDDYDVGCGQCDGEGWVHGCSWDWQCDTWDEASNECLCTRRCEFCNPAKPASVEQEGK